MENKLPLTGPAFEPQNNPKKLIFLLHGYGDSGDNFISLSKDFYDPSIKSNFYAPNAPSPVPQYPQGKQWFDLYPNGKNFNEAGPFEKELMKKDCLSSLVLIKDYINSLCLKFKLKSKDCFIIGFSQGAMMTFELGNYINEIFSGCALLSGRILPSNNYKNKPFIKTPIIIIHGDKDLVLEPKYFNEACNILNNQGYLFESHLIKDLDHTISQQTIDLTKKFIKKNL